MVHPQRHLQSYFVMIQWEVEMTVLQQQLDEDEEWEKAKQNSTGELNAGYCVRGWWMRLYIVSQPHLMRGKRHLLPITS